MKKNVGILILLLVMLLLAVSAEASIFATELVDFSSSLDGSTSNPYKNARDLLGAPARYCANWMSGGQDHISIVEPSFGRGYITTFNEGEYAIVKFDHQVKDEAGNPYGIDFTVFGNSMFSSPSGFVSDTTDLTDYMLTVRDHGGGANGDAVMVSVSQNGEDWYRYDSGPYGDTFYPANPWVWDPELFAATGNGWTGIENNYALPVNPALGASDFDDLSTYEAMLLYNGSAGGTGFDLAESGFEWIQYVKIEGMSGVYGGEVDAIADVSPVPVPGTLWLLTAPILGLARINRQRKYNNPVA